MTEASADLSNFLLPLPWQKELWLSLNDRIESQRLPHAIILNGLEGVGAEHLAYALAFRMLCSQVDKGIPCGQCSGCLTLKAGSHPDFYRLSPQEKSKFIKVDQIRKLCESVAKTSQQGGWKVVVRVKKCFGLRYDFRNKMVDFISVFILMEEAVIIIH